MKFNKIAAFASCAAMLFSMGTMIPTETMAASVCQVDTTEEYQIIRGFGGMNHPEWQSYKGGGDMKDGEIQTAFGNGEGQLGLTILRIFVSDNESEHRRSAPRFLQHRGIRRHLFVITAAAAQRAASTS